MKQELSPQDASLLLRMYEDNGAYLLLDQLSKVLHNHASVLQAKDKTQEAGVLEEVSKELKILADALDVLT